MEEVQNQKNFTNFCYIPNFYYPYMQVYDFWNQTYYQTLDVEISDSNKNEE